MTIVRGRIYSHQPPRINPIRPFYNAVGVQFPGLDSQNNPVYLSCSALNCIDNGTYSFSIWMAGFTAGSAVGSNAFITDPTHEESPLFGTVGNFNNPEILMSWDNNADVHPHPPTQFFNTEWTPTVPNTDTITWHHYLGSFFTNNPVGQKIGVLYIDDVFQIPLSQTDSSIGAFIQPVMGRPFYFGGDGTDFGTQAMGVSDAWVAPGINLLAIDSQTGAALPFIPEANRRVFTTVVGGLMYANNPNRFPAPPVLFTGGAKTFGANFGFGGTFTLTGAASNLTDIPGPGGIPV